MYTIIPLLLLVINKSNLRQSFINGKVIYYYEIYIFLSPKARISAKNFTFRKSGCCPFPIL